MNVSLLSTPGFAGVAFLATALAMAAPPAVQAQPVPAVTAGRIERLAHFPSRHVDARHVDVWVPPACEPATAAAVSTGNAGQAGNAGNAGGTSLPAAQRCRVLYMHDGQMLFDASTTWNKQAWAVDKVLSQLIEQGRVPPTIVVGIWNNGRYRHSEYFPQKFLPLMPQARRQALIDKALAGQPRSDAYLRFIVEELKPAIDARFATLTGRENTFLMGSSMGGLISVYAMNEYPQVFGGAAGLSTHWVGIHEPNAAVPLAAFNYLRDQLAPPEGHRLYQDHGTTELDAIYAPYQRFVDEIARERGYTAANSMSRVFEGTGHNERAWAARLHIPLEFLLR